eukprot:15040686-Heterocapsa_arctica.AAC.1
MVLDKAIKRVDGIRFQTFKSAVENSEVWKALLWSASTVLQFSAKDSLADEKMTRALQILSDDRLPRLVLKSEATTDAQQSYHAQVENFAGITDLSVLESFGESVSLVAEAVMMWSTLRGEQQGQLLLTEWVKAMVSSIVFVDECLTLCMEAVCARGGLPALAGSMSDWSRFKWGEAGQFVSFSNCMESHWVDEDTLEPFVDRFLKLLEGLPKHIKGTIDFGEGVKKINDQVLNNIQ